MDGGIVQRIGGVMDPEETGTLLERLGTETGHVQQLLTGLETAGSRPVLHDVPGQGRADSGNISQQVGAGGVQVDAHLVDAADDRVIQFLPKEILVDIVLVLADAEGLRIDLDQFRQRIHQAAADRYGAADRYVLVREFLPGYLGSGIDGGAVFADDIHLAGIRHRDPAHELFRLAAGGSVADGNDLDTIVLKHLGHRDDGLHLLALRRMRIDDFMVQEIALLVQAGYLAAVAETRIDGHGPFLPDRRFQQELPQVLAEDFDGFDIGFLLVLLDDFRRNGRNDEAVQGVFDGQPDLRVLGRADIAPDPVHHPAHHLTGAMVHRIDHPGRKEAFLLAAENRQEPVGRHAADVFMVGEITAVFLGGRIGLGRLRRLDIQVLPTEFLPHEPTDVRRFRRPLGDDVPGASQRFFRGRNGLARIGRRFRKRIPDRVAQQFVRQGFQPLLAGHRSTGPALRAERQVEVLQLAGHHAVFDLRAQSVRQFPLSFDGRQDRRLPLVQFGKALGPMADLGDLHIVQAAGLFLPVPADERNGIPFREHVGAVFDLPVLDLQFLCNEMYVFFVHKLVL